MHILETRSPFLLPTQTRPITLVPPIVVYTKGMCCDNSDSKTLEKFSDPPKATRAYEFVNLEKTPTSFEFSNCTLIAIIFKLFYDKK